ncbi:hypothetical protein BUE80_DR002082 [Diplocarpon rosae]|nr:hypothetical protein BUE80_DR002082 [Diplocarpon rosae]
MSFSQPMCTTPPESFMTAPLTLLPSDKKSGLALIVQDVKSCWKGRFSPVVLWASYALGHTEYKQLLRLLQEDDDLWGYDYFPYIRCFALRMPTPLHESLIFQVVRDIDSQLISIAHSNSSSAAFAKQVNSLCSATIQFPDSELAKHDPDGQFQCSEACYPGVVIEVSYSQKRKALPYLADDYILDSDANIRVVIGIDVKYKGSKKSTLSVWRPEIVTNDAGEQELIIVQTIADQRQILRDENGLVNDLSVAGLHLQLLDFAVDDVVLPHGPCQDPISISARTLCSYINKAEGSIGTMVGSAKPWIRKRRRQETPPEELRPAREKRFRMDEDKASELAEKKDSSYESSSVSEAESGASHASLET